MAERDVVAGHAHTDTDGTDNEQVREDEIVTRARHRGYITLEEACRAVNPDVKPGEVAQLLRRAGADIETKGPTRAPPTQETAGGLALELIVEPKGVSTGVVDEEEAMPIPEAHRLESDLVDSAVGMYLREIDRVPLLNAAQEITLARRIEEASEAARRLEDGPVDATERVRLEALVATGREARLHLTEANLRLVVSVAKRYTGRGLPLLDLIQEGNIGLNRAIDRFDYHRGFRFSTYAHWWIRQAVTRAIAEQSRTIRVPVHVIDLITAFFRVQHELEQKLGREPTAAEIAEKMNTTPERVQEIVRASRRPISLDTPVGAGDEERLEDLIADKLMVPTADQAAAGALRLHIEEAMEGLTERERTVLRLRFGLADGRDRTLAEIAAELGVSRERARQLEADALRKLRQPELRHRLKEYLEE